MRGTNTSTVVAVEELPECQYRGSKHRVSETDLVEVDIVAEVRVPVELWVASVDGTSAVLVPAEDVDQAVLDLLGASRKVHVLQVSGKPYLAHERAHVATAGWALDLQILPIVLVESLQTLNEEQVDGEPDRPSPVRVTTKLHSQPNVGGGSGIGLTIPDRESPGQ